MDHTFRKINSHKAIESFNDKVTTPHCYPLSIFLETTNTCNLLCPLCPTGSGIMTRPKGMISLKLAEQVFEETSDYVEDMTLGFYGEPFMHPQLITLVKLAKSYHQSIKLFSNLNITPKEGWRAFVKTGIDKIIVSLDGTNSKTYSSYRVGGSFEIVICNIKQILKFRREENLQTPIIELQMLATRDSINQWDEYVNLCKDLGVDLIKLKYLNLGNEPTTKLANQFLPEDANFHYYEGANNITIQPNFLNQINNITCKELYLGPAIISWNGDYILCCRDHSRNIQLGSLNDRSIWDFWNGEEMSLIRENFRNSTSRLKLCSNCPSLILENHTIKRIFITKQSCSKTTSQEESKFCQSIYPEIFSDDTVFHESENPEEFEQFNFSKLEPKEIKFQKGNIIDYGSYRTFTV